MVQYAFLVNRSHTDEFSPVFEIVYTTELLLLILSIALVPFVIWITMNAQPLHRNLRLFTSLVLIQSICGLSSRVIMLSGQYRNEYIVAPDWILAVASLGRRWFVSFLGNLPFSFTFERIIATRYWSWYEKQGASTFLVVAGIGLYAEASSFYLAYLMTYGESDNKADSSEALIKDGEGITIVFFFFILLGFIGFFVLLFYNQRHLRDLQKRGAKDGYSVARTFQMRETVSIMMMFIRFAGPGAVASVPLFAFTAAYQLLPQDYRFWRNLSIVMVDWWMAVMGLIGLFIFPYSDRYYRRAAYKLALFRYFMPQQFAVDLEQSTKHPQKVRRHSNTDHYFTWLERDLGVGRPVQSAGLKSISLQLAHRKN